MEYRNTNVAKIFAIALIASICIDTIMAAPVIADDKSETSLMPKSTKNPTHRRKNQHKAMKSGLNKNQDRKGETDSPNEASSSFTNEDVELWKNSCFAVGWDPNAPSTPNYNQSYDNFLLSVKSLNPTLAKLDKINTSDILIWEKFWKDSYSYLPDRPTGMALKWHQDLQIYLASFSLLHKLQLKNDISFNNLTTSNELEELRTQARALLCDIEHFVNATSNRDGNHKPHWYEKEEMEKIVNIKKIVSQERMVNNIFVKARFQQYIAKLYRRIKNFNYDKNMNHKSLKSRRPSSTKRPRRFRKNKKTTTVEYTGEPTTTAKTIIIRTNQFRKNPKMPKRQKKHNRKNQKSLQ